MLRYHGYTPRRYVDFLDYAAERIFLHRVGGGYIFIHRMLQDYFAARHMDANGGVSQERAGQARSTPS
jgi:hypothetical protein